MINVSYNLEVRPNTHPMLGYDQYEVCLHTGHFTCVCAARFIFFHMYLLNNPPTYTLPRGGRGPTFHPSDQRGTRLTSSSTTTHRRHSESPPSTPRGRGRHARHREGGGWTHVTHTLMRQTVKHMYGNNSWHASSLMYAQHNLVRVWPSGRESCVKCAFSAF